MWWYVQQFCCSAVSVDSGDEFGDDVGEHCDCVIFITIEDDFCCGGCFTFFSFHHSITLCALHVISVCLYVFPFLLQVLQQG